MVSLPRLPIGYEKVKGLFERYWDSVLRAIEQAFTDIQQAFTDIGGLDTKLSSAAFLTLQSEPSLGAERVLALEDGDLVGVDEGANGAYTLGLSTTSVTAGSFGSGSRTVTLTVDPKGRITDINDQTIELEPSGVTAGTYSLPTSITVDVYGRITAIS